MPSLATVASLPETPFIVKPKPAGKVPVLWIGIKSAVALPDSYPYIQKAAIFNWFGAAEPFKPNANWALLLVVSAVSGPVPSGSTGT